MSYSSNHDRALTGAPDANAIPIPKDDTEVAMDGATCIGCSACVAACKNASAMLFVSAKVGQFAKLPQGRVERERRVQTLMKAMDTAGFGNCTNYYGLLCQVLARLPSVIWR